MTSAQFAGLATRDRLPLASPRTEPDLTSDLLAAYRQHLQAELASLDQTVPIARSTGASQVHPAPIGSGTRARERRSQALRDVQRQALPPTAPGASSRQPQGTPPSSGGLFRRFSQRTAAAVGSPFAFMAAVAIVAGWALSGPLFSFKDTWQLVINTGTTIVTFLMVFLIQNTQNRDSRAIQLKLDELVHAVSGARNKLVDVEDEDERSVKRLEQEFQAIHEAPAAAG